MKDFMENADGVHIMNPHLSEFTLCGDSFDIQSTEDLPLNMKLLPSESETVTCPICIQIIEGLKGVKTRRKPLNPSRQSERKM